MKITIQGNPITKKNSSQIVRSSNGRSYLIPSKQYKIYSKSFSDKCKEFGIYGLGMNGRYNIQCEYYMQTKRKVDLTNLLSASMDCLVEANVIEDDNCTIACSHDGSRVRYDKENPRVVITIEENENGQG